MSDRAAERWNNLTLQGGPDFFAEFRFTERAPDALREAVARIGLAGFERFTRQGEVMRSEMFPPQMVASYDVYADPHHADEVALHLAGEATSNLWIFRTITVGPGTLWIELGYPAHDLPGSRAVVGLLRGLLADPSLTLTRYELVAGGQGYPPTPLAAGHTGDELLALLTAA